MSHYPPFSSDYNPSSEDEDDIQFIDSVDEQRRRRQQQRARRGSVPGRRTINRERGEGHLRIYRDYFAEPPVYPEHIFRRRFRMSTRLFTFIMCAVSSYDEYFVHSQDAAGVWGLTTLQKVTAVFKMLCYGVAADAVDEYVRIAETTAILCLRRFVKAIDAIFSEQYLRSPTEEDTARLLQINEQRGFPGMLGSIDCMHWRWKNCPTAWAGAYTGHHRDPTIILEAVASQDLWIWHAFFGIPGSQNDLNVLQVSDIFQPLAENRAPLVNFTVNGNNYTTGYYLADGIYPSWPVFVKTIPARNCLGRANKYFATQQEAARKDIERAFGVLQARFAIIRGPARMWDVETLRLIMKTCIILHNMIIEDEGDNHDIDYDYEHLDGSTPITVERSDTEVLESFIEKTFDMRDKAAHYRLQKDLIEHMWNIHGGA